MKDALRELAGLYGVQTAYMGVDGLTHAATAEALLAVLRAMGAPLEDLGEVSRALRQRRQALWQSVICPVALAWQGAEGAIDLRLPETLAGGAYKCLLEIEGGQSRQFGGRVRNLPMRGRRVVEGVRYGRRQLSLPAGLPSGYHRLSLELAGRVVTSLVVAAPREAPSVHGPGERMWGAFLPLHALHRASSWGAGDLGDLAALVEWVAQRGGRAVQTLPLLSELRELGDGPTPYEPATRLFWDEFYLTVDRLPHLAQCPQARALLARPGTQAELQALRQGPLVDYAAQMQLKRRILDVLAKWYFAGSDQSGLDAYLRRRPLARTYAQFRAVGERRGTHWNQWAASLRAGRIEPGDYDSRVYQYYLYVQWQMEEQFQHLAQQARAQGVRLCLDLPVGVRRDGFDAWAHQNLFVPGVGVGAPPDGFFPQGQNWGFAPPDPQRQRQELYGYWRGCLAQHLESAGILRVDHVMGLHRLYCIPDGMAASEGVYVRYPAQELLAILTLEAHRHKAAVVGENLGTVPPEVNRDMRRHGILSMYVVPFEVSPGPRPVRRPPPKDCLACLNTHDMPTFTALWQGLDIQVRQDLGVLNASQSRQEQAGRRKVRQALLAYLRKHGFALADDSPPADVLEVCLSLLGTSKAAIVMVNLEDLWGEERPQNAPGVRSKTTWRRKARYNLEEFSHQPDVLRMLDTLDRRRQAGRVSQPRRAPAKGRTR